jgi:YfiH family protein
MQPDLGLRLQPAHAHQASVVALMSTRQGGVSQLPYGSCNLGDHVQDAAQAVAHNRHLVAQVMGLQPVWLTQVHGNRIVRLSRISAQTCLVGAEAGSADTLCVPLQGLAEQPQADGALTTEPGLACTVMVADCLPILLAAPEGRGVAALHAGWRGLAGAGTMAGRGIVHTGVAALCEAASGDPADLCAWLGPCIGPAQFEVGADVLAGFGVDPFAALPHPRFVARAVGKMDQALGQAQASSAPTKWLADLPGLAGDILTALGVRSLSGGAWCTATDASRFFSFRRDGVTGRQAASIGLRLPA